MTTPTVTEIRRHGNLVGQRVEVGRYTVAAGERVLYGQRVNGVVRFLLGSSGVLAQLSTPSEDDICSSRRGQVDRARPNAARRKRPNGSPTVRLPDARETS